jgi:hypothetical protein
MIKYCLHCGKSSESDIEMKFCPHCGTPFEMASQSESPGKPLPAPPPSLQAAQPSRHIPWEDRSKEGFLGSLYETWKQSCFYPADFYKNMPILGGIWNPLFYGLLASFVGLIFQMIYAQIFSDIFDPMSWVPASYRSFDPNLLDFTRRFRSMSNIFSIVALPFAATLGIFIWSGLIHLELVIFGWKKEDYEASFRLIAYSEGPNFFKIIPFAGDMVAVIWQIVLVVIGIRTVHNTSTGKALLVVFLPLILTCLCCCALVFWIIGIAGFAR